MNSCLYLYLLFITSTTYAQLTILPVVDKASPRSIKTTPILNAKDAQLPFWDDFSISKNTVDSIRIWRADTFLQWNSALSRGVFVNSTLAINPPTYNTATFDGLDEKGGIYSAEENASGLADQLVSHPVNLLGSRNVYISFYWQAGGNVEAPEPGDSLRLQLRDTSAIWRTVWQRDGGDHNDTQLFEQEILEITDRYTGDSFCFRFQSFGDLDGPFDAWHIDWIYINKDRTSKDISYEDRAITGDLTSPFRPFQAIPVHQFSTKFLKNQTVGSSNLHHDVHTNEMTYKIRNTISNELIVDDPLRLYSTLFAFQRDTITLLEGTDRQNHLSDFQFSTILNFDSVVLEAILEYKSNDDTAFASSIDLRLNDTIRENYTLHNYYALDDGTAEYAAGTNLRNGQIAVKYWADNPDTLTHIDIYFPNIAPNQEGKPITLKVFSELNEQGMSRAQQVSVENNTARNAFTRYALDHPLVVSDTFFIGYQQAVNDFLAVGLDRSNPDASQYIFENKDGNWIQNINIKGALMIRPVFENNTELTLGESPPLEVALKTYPNPTNGTFRIEGDYDKIKVIDLGGHTLLTETKKDTHDISKLKQGMYLLVIFRPNRWDTQKIIRK